MSPTAVELGIPASTSSVGLVDERRQREKSNLSGELQELAFNELGETPDVRSTCLEAVRQWLDSQPHLRDCPREEAFLLRFLRSQKFNVARSQKQLVKYLRCRANSPQWLTELDAHDEAVRQLMESGFFFVLPERDSSGRRVIVNCINRLDLNAGFTNQDVMKAVMITLEVLLREEENQIRGFTYIFYCKNMTLAHCSIWSPSDAARVFNICEKSLPVRHSDINLVHLSLAAWAVVEFVKQFLSAKIKNRIETVDNNEKLTEKLDADILPMEWGGSIPMSTMGCQWREEVEQHSSYLKSLDSIPLVSDEDLDAVDLSNSVEGLPSAPDDDVSPSTHSRKSSKAKKVSGLWSYIPGMSS